MNDQTDNSKQPKDDKDPKIQRTVHGVTVKIDRNVCIGAGTCIAVAPKAWALDEEAKAVLLDSVSEETKETLVESARACPVAAITITDENGRQLFP